MVLDKTKKYEFAGDVYTWEDGENTWYDGDNTWFLNQHFQKYADRGLVTEIEEPMVRYSTIEFDSGGYRVNSLGGAYYCQSLGISVEEAIDSVWDVVATKRTK
jgi:hypothetical protein